MKKFAGFAAMAVLAFTVVGCSDSMSPAAPSAMSVTEEARGNSADSNGRAGLPTIAGTAVAAGSFETLVYALGKAGLVETFNGAQQYTVFAPTDTAFQAAADANGLASGKALVDYLDANDLLTPVLLYHVAQGDRRAQGVVSSGQVKMLDGNWASISLVGKDPYIDGAKILTTDIIASNGIIHVLGGVMLPPGFGE
jgi:uncharacterized surface protein with fasciclin (FAS1) repeats